MRPSIAFALVTAVILGCGGSDSGHSGTGQPVAGTDVPDVPPPGFATVVLTAADPPPASSDQGPSAPSGTVWYRMTNTPQSGHPPSFEWYVRGRQLRPGRIFRVELSVDDRGTYSVGSGRSDSAGTLTAHGTLTRFADQYCVGTLAEPMSLLGPHRLSFSVKSDGSGAGSATFGAPVTDPRRALPCGGNGDGIFDYWLVAHEPVVVGAEPGSP